MKKIVSVVAARPNFVKLASVHHALTKHSNVEHIIVHTGQHYDPLLSDVFFEQLHLPQPARNLGIHGGTREEVIRKTEAACVEAFSELKPDSVIVYGDVNGALGAARAAKALGIQLVHVEAGLRSGDLDMPEERNRIAIDSMANYLFCTEKSALEHLEEEGIKEGERGVEVIKMVGNTMIDTLLMKMSDVKAMETLTRQYGEHIVVTIHRPSNVDNPDQLRLIMNFLGDVANITKIIFPVHLRTRKTLSDFKIETSPNIHLMEPLGYLGFMSLIRTSIFTLSDSAGVQEESLIFGKRCFTLRRNTERPCTIESGSNILIDPSKEEDRQKVLDYAKNPVAPHITIPEKWDGKAGERIAEIMASL